MNLELESERLVLSPFTPEGFDNYFRVVSNGAAMKWITGNPVSHEEALKRFEEILRLNESHSNLGFFAIRIKDSGVFIGLGKLEPADPGVVELGYALLPAHWGQGFGSELLRHLIQHAASLPGLHRLIAYIAPENQASRRILEKCGFTLERVGDWKGLPTEVYQLDLLEDKDIITTLGRNSR